jgi:hypothetical protein
MDYEIKMRRYTFTGFSTLGEIFATLNEARAALTERAGIDCSAVNPGEIVHAGDGSNDGPWYRIDAQA